MRLTRRSTFCTGAYRTPAFRDSLDRPPVFPRSVDRVFPRLLRRGFVHGRLGHRCRWSLWHGRWLVDRWTRWWLDYRLGHRRRDADASAIARLEQQSEYCAGGDTGHVQDARVAPVPSVLRGGQEHEE